MKEKFFEQFKKPLPQPKKRALIIFFVLLGLVLLFGFIGIVSAENWSEIEINIDGLTPQTISVIQNQTGLTFQNDYLNLSLEYIDFFIPEELQDDLGYLTPCNPSLMVCQGNSPDPIYGQTNLFHVLNDWTNNYNDEFYIETDFIFTYSQYDPDQDIPEGFNFKRINQELTINYENNFGLGELLASGIIIDEDTRIEIILESHYEHLIITWNFIYDDEITGSFSKVFSGTNSELIPIDYQINKFEDISHGIVDRGLIYFDNLFEEEHEINLTIAYPIGKDFLGLKTSSGEYTEIPNQYNSVISKAEVIGSSSTLLENINGYDFKSFSISIQENSTDTLSFMIPSEYGESNDLRMWIEGSFAGGSGTSSDPYEIETWAQLDEVRDYLSSDFILMNDLNEDSTGYSTYAGSSANSGEGWEPIGTASEKFTGTLTGNNHVLSNIVLKGNLDYLGLFGVVSSEGVILNIGVDNVSIVGSDNLGGLIGRNEGEIHNCYSKGRITGSTMLGGLIGRNEGEIHNCYSKVNLSKGIYGSSSSPYVGGLVGFNYYGLINNSFSVGTVSYVGGLYRIGGLVGENTLSSTYNSFWDTETSNQTESEGGSGKTTTQMQSIEIFLNAGWDIETSADHSNETWSIVNGTEYPLIETSYIFLCESSIVNSSWSDWSDVGCVVDEMNQSRTLTQYDENFCGDTENITFYEYQSLEANYFNTTWSGWSNEACLITDLMNQSRSLEQYNNNSCGNNIAFYEYRAIDFCDYCTPSLTNSSWSGWLDTEICQEDSFLTQARLLYQTDENECGETEDESFYEYQEINCTYDPEALPIDFPEESQFINIPNNFENVTTMKGMLGVANDNTGGYTYIGLLIMMQVIILIALIVFGFEAAILASAFIALVAGLFLTYLDLISFKWLMFFVAQILIMMIYITWQRRK